MLVEKTEVVTTNRTGGGGNEVVKGESRQPITPNETSPMKTRNNSMSVDSQADLEQEPSMAQLGQPKVASNETSTEELPYILESFT